MVGASSSAPAHIIRLAEYKAQRDAKANAPHANCLQVIDGEPWYLFAVSYRVGYALFECNIWALDAADAQSRVDAMRSTAAVVGQVLSIT